MVRFEDTEIIQLLWKEKEQLKYDLLHILLMIVLVVKIFQKLSLMSKESSQQLNCHLMAAIKMDRCYINLSSVYY